MVLPKVGCVREDARDFRRFFGTGFRVVFKQGTFFIFFFRN